MKKFTFTIILLTLSIFACGCKNKSLNIGLEKDKINTPVTEASDNIKERDVDLSIITTDRIIYYMVMDIVKDKHNVEFMFKSKFDDENFNFTNDSLNNISKKDLFLYIGANFEPWIDNFMSKLNRNKVDAVNLSRGINIIPYTYVVKYKENILKDNPYYLGAIDNYKIALLNVKNAIQDKDPKNRNFYEDNYNDALKNIKIFEDAFKSMGEQLKNYTFICAEDDMDYFFKYLGFKTFKLNSMSNIKAEDKEKLFKKVSEIKGPIAFAYSNPKIIPEYKEVIEKFKLINLNLQVYQDDLKYLDMLKKNLEELTKLTNI